MNADMERTSALPSQPKALVHINVERAPRSNRVNDANRTAALLGSATVLRVAYASNLLKIIDAVKIERNRT